jgi:hypothetical protein
MLESQHSYGDPARGALEALPWSPSTTACMGGYKQRCVDRGGNGTYCGGDPVMQGSGQVLCGGG